jgi:dihydrofolate reductase
VEGPLKGTATDGPDGFPGVVRSAPTRPLGSQEALVRKVVLYTLMSLDGAVEEPGRYFIPRDEPGGPPEFDSVMADNEAEVIGSQDAVLLGRRMYDEWSRYWPTSDEEPFATFINSVTKYVVTSTPLANEWHNAQAVEGPVEELVRRLQAQGGGDIGVHGSIELAQSLLGAGLVDELRLVVGPAVGFTGRRLFDNTQDIRRFELLSTTPTPSGSVLLAYRAG